MGQQVLDSREDFVDDDEVPYHFRVENALRDNCDSHNRGEARETHSRRNKRESQRRETAVASKHYTIFGNALTILKRSLFPRSSSDSENVPKQDKTTEGSSISHAARQRNDDVIRSQVSRQETGDLNVQSPNDKQHEQLDWKEIETKMREQFEKEWNIKENDLEKEYRNQLSCNESECYKTLKDLQILLEETRAKAEQNRLSLQTKIDIALEAKDNLEAEHNAFIRKLQEASFEQMESARWLPEDENKVICDLDKLKRSMRSWAKSVSVQEISAIEALGTAAQMALMHELSKVVILESGQLPACVLSTKRSPTLLVNALLAHHVYTSFFKTPFFCFEETAGDGPRGILDHILDLTKSVNPQDANIWRSQTLRLVMPPLRNDTSEDERLLHNETLTIINKVARDKALSFMAGPVSCLIHEKAKPEVTKKLQKIFHDAAQQAFMLWTRRTEMKCLTFQDIEQVHFNSESGNFEPDTLVRFEDHSDRLKGRPVSIMVHPLLQVAGNDDAKGFDETRVWSKGVVWLDSRSK